MRERELAIASSSSQYGSPAEHIVLCPGWEMYHFKLILVLKSCCFFLFKSVIADVFCRDGTCMYGLHLG